MSSLFSITEGAAPEVAVEIAAGRVSAAMLEWRAGRPTIAAHAVEPLPPAAIVPSLTSANTVDRPAVMTALNRVLERAGRPRRIGLVLPDVVARVSLIRFEQVPARATDLDQLVRWQVRKSAPFPIEDAQVSYARGLRMPDGQDFIVTLARRTVIEEYEALCAEAGASAGLVDLATLNVINAVVAGPAVPSGDWLLVNVAADSASIAIMRGADLIFFRNRASDTDGTVADLMHQTAMYYEDRLKGGGFARVMLAGSSQVGADIDEIRRSLEERAGTAVEPVDPRQAAVLTDRISASPAFLDTLAPLVGLLLRDRRDVVSA
jgi:Tfp pilus assembly PilM family ATPase